MNASVYEITIRKEGIYHQKYFFIGQTPTKNDLLEAIDRRLNGSLVHDNIWNAHCSTKIVKELGIPTDVGPTDKLRWCVLDTEVGSIQMGIITAWNLKGKS